MAMRYPLGDVGIFMIMVMMECTIVVMNLVCKAAMLKGMSNLVMTVYSYALATLILLPFPFIFNRTTRPPLTFRLICIIFLLALVGSTSMTCGYAGLRYSSPALSAAIGNLIPAFTLILAVITRMEKLDLRSSSSLSKTIGTIVAISGAFVVTLYKGPPLILTSSTPQYDSSSNWVIGGLLFALQCFLVSVWYIIQTSIVKDYPAELIILLIYNFFATIQTATVSLIAEGDPSAWKLWTGLELTAVITQAVFTHAVSTGVGIWCVHKKGPVYAAMFTPLEVVIAFLMGFLFLGDTINLGSLIGAIIIVIGFYSVMWGKAKEVDIVVGNSVSTLESTSQKVPLLQNSNPAFGNS